MALLSATNSSCLPLPASHLPRATPLPQPFCAAQACDGRKELLVVLAQDDFLPSHASVVVLVGRGWETIVTAAWPRADSSLQRMT